ncbi:MAG: hypothetical protein HY583_01585, partial [Candidatus Omnitrophica bacterium]|nr:hypothetical protein [Candidatus Omnitrophota bacterium]
DVVKAKQAQKYLLEQAKMREKSRFARMKVIGREDSSSPDVGPTEPAAE